MSVCERISETTLHLTFLLVEREVSNVDGARALVDSDSDQILTYLLARALVDGGRDPQHVAMVEDDHIGLVRHFVLAVGTAPTEIDVTGTPLSPSDRAMRLVSSNLANCHATVQKLLIRQVLNKLMV